MLFEADVGHENNTNHSDVLLWCDNVYCKLQRWKGKVLQRASRTSPEQLGLIHIQLQSIAYDMT